MHYWSSVAVFRLYSHSLFCTLYVSFFVGCLKFQLKLLIHYIMHMCITWYRKGCVLVTGLAWNFMSLLIGFLLYSYLKLKRKNHPRDQYTVQLLQKGRAVTVVKHTCESKANSSKTPALPLSAACFYCAGGRRGYKIGLSCTQRVSLHITLGCAKVSCEVKCQYKR